MHLLLGQDKYDAHTVTFQITNSIDPYDCGLYSLVTNGGSGPPPFMSISIATPLSVTLDVSESLVTTEANSYMIQFQALLDNWPSKTLDTEIEIYTYCCDPTNILYVMTGETTSFNV